MATRSLIGAKFDPEVVGEEAGIVATYCRYDGYLSGVGMMLFGEYTGDDAFLPADAGYLSGLPEREKFFETVHLIEFEPSYFKSENSFFTSAGIEYGAEFAYLWKDGAWYFSRTNSNGGFSTPVKLEGYHFLPELRHGLKYAEENGYKEDAEEYKKLIEKYS